MRKYVSGYILSIFLTLTAFVLVMQHLLSGPVLVFTVIGLALIQLWVQLIFFLHLDREKGPRWNLLFFLSTIGIVLILFVGSIWIMNHLNYNMTPQETNNYLLQQENILK
jgi:cytochrome o ubiquinol oxidase operon protein cyoD